MADTGTLAVLTAVYDVEIFISDCIGSRVEYGIGRDVLLGWIRITRQVDSITIKYSRRWLYAEYEVTMCAACNARPSLWDMDCDDWCDTVTCGVCDWSAAFNLRYPELTR